MIDLWRYLEQGVTPEGVVLKPLVSGQAALSDSRQLGAV